MATAAIQALFMRQLRFPRRLKRGSVSYARFSVSSSQNCAPRRTFHCRLRDRHIDKIQDNNLAKLFCNFTSP